VKKVFNVLIFVLLTLCPGRSQHTLMRTHNINDGLVCNQIRGFYQDKKGFIWITTWEGLSRFDGYTFRNYTMAEGLSHPLINTMIEGKDGRLYIAENDGSMDVILNGEVQRDMRKKKETVINKFVKEDSGRILAPSDEKGVCVFDEGSITSLNQAGISISANAVISDDDLFIVCGTKSGALRPDHTFLKLWSDSIPDYLSLLQDQHKQIWVGTSEGLRWVNMSSDPSARYDLVPTSFQNTLWSKWIIRDMIETTDGSIWIGAVGGLIQIKPDQSWRLYGRKDGLPSEYVTSIFQDNTGFLWIGTDQGVAQLDINNTIDILTIAEDLPNSMPTDIQPTLDGGAFIVSEGSSVLRIRPNQPLTSIDLGNVRRVYEFLTVGTDTLVSTDKGYVKLNHYSVYRWADIPHTVSPFSSEMDNGCIFSSATNVVTISCPDGSYRDTTMDDVIFALSPGTEHDMWVGTLNLGVHRAVLKRNALGKMELEWQNFNDYLPEQTIRSLHVDAKGNIWIGTRYSGLVQLYRDTLTGKYKTQIYDRSDGFISDFIKSIVSDHDGNIWVGTHAGIEKLIPTPNGFRTFSFSRVYNFFATVTKLEIGTDHFVWCTTTSGVARIKDSRYDTIPPSEVYITSVSTAKELLLDPQQQLPFDLSHNQNFMDIEFSSNDHINGRQLKYSYRLVGSQDTAWSKPEPVHKVSFANLLPGDYHVEVRALGWNGILGDETAYHFRIRPPFWQQTWFVVLAVLVLLALLYSFYRYRISQLNRVQQVRDRIASDLHDEIGSSLTHVNILSEIGKKTADSDDHPQQLFTRIGEEVQSSSEALDDIIWSVSSRADTAEDLVSRMRRYASELFDVKGISFVLHEDQLDVNQAMGLELRRDFYLIYKELLRNILRHAEASEVHIRIRGEHHFLWMEINDNGQGFDPQAPSERHGLQSIKGRVAKWKGHLSIDSSAGQGTLIKVGLPVKTRLSLKNM